MVPHPSRGSDVFMRERVALALSAVVHEVGLRQLSVSRIAKQAEMSPAAFYLLFENREAAVRYAVELGGARLRGAIDDASGSGDPWEQRVEAVIQALLESAVAEPQLAELCLVLGRAVEGAPFPCDPALVQALAEVLRAGRSDASAVEAPPRTEEMISSGILSVIADRLPLEEAGDLSELAGELSQLATEPFRTGSSPQRTRRI